MNKLFITLSLFAALAFSAPASAADAHFTAINQSIYSSNMTIVAQIKDGESILAGVEVAVFAGSECRTTQVSDENGFVFLTIPGDSKTTLTFSVYGNGIDRSGLNSLDYVSDKMIGTMTDPFVVNLNPTFPSGVTNPESIITPGENANGSNANSGSGSSSQEPTVTPQPEKFTTVDPGAYSGNMTLVAIVKDRDEAVAGAEVGVFAGEECRGAAVTDDKGRAFVTIAGNAAVALTLSVHTATADTVGIAAFDFQEDAMIGDPSKPYVIQIGKDAPVDPGKEDFPIGDVSAFTESMTFVATIRDGATVVPGAEVAIYDGSIYRATAIADNFGIVQVTIPGAASEELFLCVRTESRGFVADVLKFNFASGTSLGTASAPTAIQLDPSYTEENAIRTPSISRIALWPNPAVDYVVVNAEANALLTVVAQNGATAISTVTSEGETRVDVAALPAGIYYVCIQTAKGKFVASFIKH